MATAIGVVAGLMGIFTFTDNYLAPEEPDNSVIQVAVAVDGSSGTENGGGDLPDVRLFNIYGEFLGMTSDPGTVGDGEVGEIKVYQENGQQAPYALFSANSDAICIAYSTVTWPTSEKYWWDGSWGEACGQTWYYSGVYIQESDYRPTCTWIDADGDQPATGFQVHWPTFADESLDGQNASALCQGIDYNVYFEEDPNTIIFDPNPNDKRSFGHDSGAVERSAPAAPALINDKVDRSTRFEQVAKAQAKRARKMQARQDANPSIVIDDAPENVAAKLCQSETSVGPDFANVEDGFMCRMSDKTLYPLCAEGVDEVCFNMDTLALQGGLDARDEIAPKKYGRVRDWRSGAKKNKN